MIRKILVPLLLLIITLAGCGQAEPTPTTEAVDLPAEAAVEEATETPTRAALAAAPVSQEQMTAEAAESPMPGQTAETQPEVEAQETPEAEETLEPETDAAEILPADMLANMTYSSEFTAGGTAPLVDGEYSEAPAPGSATETTVWLTDHIAHGELNGQPVAAVVLISDPGGSGTFYSLHVVGLEAGEPVELAATPLGDRVIIDSLAISGDQITLEMVTAGPDDPLCCPTQQVVQVYELGGGELLKTADEVVGSAAESAAGGLVNRIWGWQERQGAAGDDVSIDDPGQYTLIFQEDGTYQYIADCSPGGGIYTIDGDGGITLLASIESLANCGPDSHAAAMKEGLRQAQFYRRENDHLLLTSTNPENANGEIVDTYVDLGPAVPETSGLAIASDQISLDTQGLFETWTAVEVPGRAVDSSSPPGPRGLPDHVEIYFDYVDPAERDGRAIMYIIPVDAYSELYNIAGYDWVEKNINAIYEFAVAPQDPPPTSGVPMLPNEELAGINDFAVHVGGTNAGLESASQTGYRFVGRSVQDPNLVTNENLRYIYQGFTNDGKYLVAFFSPINSSELPQSAGEASQESVDALNNDAAAYLEQEAQRLNAIPPEDWLPDLITLDAIINSLRIEYMVPAGLQNSVWQWTGQINDPTGGEVTENDLAGHYSAEYSSDLVLSFVADCNLGSSTYGLTAGGMAGRVLAEPAETVFVDCDAGSFSQEFAALLVEAEAYRVLPGGEEMILALPNGRGDYVFSASDDLSGGSGLDVESSSRNNAPAVSSGSVSELVDSGITLDVTGLAKTYAWEVRPETPIPAQPGGHGLPEHVLLTFDGEQPADALANDGRRLYVIPAQQYVDLYETAGRDVVGNQINRLRDLISSGQGRETPPDGWMPLLPPPDSLMDHWVQFRDYDFSNGMGVRYVAESPLRQSGDVWSSDSTGYYYQGLTENGRFYVSLWWPVSTEALPATSEEALPDVRQMAENPETQASYIQDTRQALNDLPPNAFLPSLAQLDVMVNSLAVGEQ
ncbi:MAG: META domain-containing protein [Candidatus Promineifilaceae bacterium]